jgi:hypothetical protein
MPIIQQIIQQNRHIALEKHAFLTCGFFFTKIKIMGFWNQDVRLIDQGP